jgi:hypothetical protein
MHSPNACHIFEQALSRRKRALEGYMHNLHRGRIEVRGMIREDIARFSDLGARRHVSDLEAVLLQFDSARIDERNSQRGPGPGTSAQPQTL